MGLLVYSGVLPSGVAVSNVYISFSYESVYVRSIPISNTFEITSCYRVFSDQTKNNGCNIRVPIQVIASNTMIGQSVYDILYQKMKEMFPNSQHVFDNIPGGLGPEAIGPAVQPGVII